MELFCSGYGYRPHYNAENNHWKRSHSKTLSRVEWFENDAVWKRCFLVWTEKMMLSENGDVIKIDTTGRQTTPAWASKMADRRYHVVFNFADRYIEMHMRRVHLSMHTEGIKTFSKPIRWKWYQNDKCGSKSFWKWSKTAPFSNISVDRTSNTHLEF